MRHKPSAVRFFFSHAGYSYDPKTETKIQGRWKWARALATAEKAGQDQNLEFVWEYDQYPDTSWMDEQALKELENGQTEILECVARQDGVVLASLCGIHIDVNDRHQYRRVVEAELAMEALAHLEQEAAADMNV